jgi:(R)-2-hydroxyacyl-CoA dehydratese activating ATPase
MGISAGLDVGSTAIKLAIMENGIVVRREAVDTASRPLDVARKLLVSVPEACPIFAAGYGRDLVEENYGFPTITEIKAHATGARFLDPECEAVIDIGGQDVKIISLDSAGRVAKFEMNDRCSAGTGRFLEIMATRLGYAIGGFADASARGAGKVSIHSMCTVFAESEIVGLLSRGNRAEDIGHALHASIARRIAAIVSRIVSPGYCILATGGGSQNALLVSMISALTGCAITTHELSPFAGAIGCALHAKESTPKEEVCRKQS